MLDIIFISDYVCPYCYAAKEALKRALALTGIEAQIRQIPFELTPESKPPVDTWNDPVRRAHYKALEEPCMQMGLPIKLPPRVIPRPYTHLAFQGWYYACGQGLGGIYNDAVYRAYFEEELDIGSIDVLTDIAGKIGLDRERFRKVLEYGLFSEQVSRAVDDARRIYHPQGVPAIYINGSPADIERYTVQEMAGLLTNAAPVSSGEAFTGCGSDGC